MVGTLSNGWDLLKKGYEVNQYLQALPVRVLAGDSFDREKQFIDHAGKVAAFVGGMGNSVAKEIGDYFVAQMTHDYQRMDAQIKRMSPQIRKALALTDMVVTEAGIAALRLSPENKGRVYGYILYEVVEFFVTAAAAKALKAGAVGRLAGRLKGVAGLEAEGAGKVTKAFEAVLEAVVEVSEVGQTEKDAGKAARAL